MYLAEDRKLHRQVAIKKLKDDAASQNARDRIQQEARLLAQLNHPNIVALYDVLEEGDSIALVMEYIEGTTLRAWMRERRPSLQQKLSLLMQICKGLTEAHNLGIIHRDLKSDNILIAENSKGEPVAKITDFGIAKSQQLDEKTLTAENQLAGTITAMSPEQIQGKPLDARSDLFSLGTIAFELLCGSRPFEKHEGGALAMASRITSEPHIPPQQAWPGIPEPLAVLLDKLLAKDPTQRPQSALIVYQGFELLYKQGLESDTEDFTATLTDLFTHHKVKSRRRWQRALAGVAAVLVLSASGYWGWKEITRLEPQYIAVMPVEINGEIRGEENAKALTATMVRQALMNSVSQLKASALVSFTPKEGQDFETQLKKLKDKGVTDALFAQLDCARARCEISLQRIAPENNQIKRQESFTFLTDKKQEAQYRTSNSAALLFPPAYQRELLKQVSMSDDDYRVYLDILDRMEAKALDEKDLGDLTSLSDRYPRNAHLYQSISDVAARLFVLGGNTTHLESALRTLEKADNFGISKVLTSRLKLFIYGLGDYPEQYQQLISTLETTDFPLAELLSERARNHYRNGDYESGLKYAREAAELNPSADNLYLIALNQIASGNYDNGRVTLNKTITTFPEHWSSYSALGVIELESGNLETAEKAITSIPEQLRGWRTSSNLGVVYFLQQKYQESLNTYQKVLRKVPEDVPTLGQVAETYLMLDNNGTAQHTFNKILHLTEEQEDLESARYRAVALANMNHSSEAIPLILELLKKAPEDTDIKYNAAQIYALAGERSSANYYIEQLLVQGMSAEWFNLPAFQQLCPQPQISEQVRNAICD
ncbi:serine/threonine-protein kinase [Microbulbifer hydrolyticus]|uniref:Serine/threonine-protein kinase n=1 Tax=Microbulbifer hydrolyticus TaxID=48074 RepID=A0AA89PBF5_9GAMM|nr:serine/threonine-protein kinase [Microbulbifer hydrolyticus]MBB5211004.1 serine/threonine-protein kinase [Microbulbifer hydrolyticus]